MLSHVPSDRLFKRGTGDLARGKDSTGTVVPEGKDPEVAHLGKHIV